VPQILRNNGIGTTFDRRCEYVPIARLVCHGRLESCNRIGRNDRFRKCATHRIHPAGRLLWGQTVFNQDALEVPKNAFAPEKVVQLSFSQPEQKVAK
jgi:hypothetical protein